MQLTRLYILTGSSSKNIQTPHTGTMRISTMMMYPIGFKHDGIEYKQNYGYIKELKTLDNEYQDAYVIGVDKTIKTFNGKVIAIINRKNDIEDKLVVCDKDKTFTKQEIKQLVDFQEKYFKSKIIMFDNRTH